MTVSVAVIGLGSRGLSVLERLLALAGRTRLRIELIDPVGDGAGVHAVDQPDYLLLNTICSQVSMFPDPLTVGDTVRLTGPSLHEWALERRLRIAPDGFTVGTTGRPIEPWDFLPRRLLGEYLGWFRNMLLDNVPHGVDVRLHRSAAVRLQSGGSGLRGSELRGSGLRGSELRIELASGERLSVDQAFLTTGYTDNVGAEHPSGRLIGRPYPMPEQLEQIRAGQTVAITGFGLSALDAMSCLTVGRGGRYQATGDGLRYLPSGAEPRLLFYSRSGRACRARPRILRYGPAYRPLVFTPAGIDRLRAEHGALDFDRQLWPLVLDELRICYRRAEARAAGPAAVDRLERRLAEVGGLGALLDDLDAEHGRFCPERLLAGAQPMALASATDYQGWFAAELAADLAEGELGLQGSIVKQTLDILRELRDTFRHAVDFGGLTPQSSRQFFQQTVPVLNRAVVGPQFERHQELLTLLADGIAAAPLGPDPLLSWDPEAGNWLLESRHLAVPHTGRADWLVGPDRSAVGRFLGQPAAGRAVRRRLHPSQCGRRPGGGRHRGGRRPASDRCHRRSGSADLGARATVRGKHLLQQPGPVARLLLPADRGRTPLRCRAAGRSPVAGSRGSRR
ncbi:MAG TPA: FAD/NAD(P)-binding protein [Jatrophihabitans sp.]|nr:FAD/NAD(P)-binding protein [Jatrophihabitans sp.]